MDDYSGKLTDRRDASGKLTAFIRANASGKLTAQKASGKTTALGSRTRGVLSAQKASGKPTARRDKGFTTVRVNENTV